MKTMIAAVALITLGSATAIAQPRHGGGLEGWQERQMQRIEDGRRSGAITWTEGNRLRAEQRNILITRQRLEADGRLTRRDRRVIRRMLREAQYNISDLANDSHRRLWWAPRVGR